MARLLFGAVFFKSPSLSGSWYGSGPAPAPAAAAAASLAFANLILRITLGGTAFGLGVPRLVPCLDSVILAAPCYRSHRSLQSFVSALVKSRKK